MPWPSWPRAFAPQHSTLPEVSNAQAWSAPTDDVAGAGDAGRHRSAAAVDGVIGFTVFIEGRAAPELSFVALPPTLDLPAGEQRTGRRRTDRDLGGAADAEDLDGFVADHLRRARAQEAEGGRPPAVDVSRRDGAGGFLPDRHVDGSSEAEDFSRERGGGSDFAVAELAGAIGACAPDRAARQAETRVGGTDGHFDSFSAAQGDRDRCWAVLAEAVAELAELVVPPAAGLSGGENRAAGAPACRDFSFRGLGGRRQAGSTEDEQQQAARKSLPPRCPQRRPLLVAGLPARKATRARLRPPPVGPLLLELGDRVYV